MTARRRRITRKKSPAASRVRRETIIEDGEELHACGDFPTQQESK